MTAQMSLLAPVADRPIEVPVCRSVLHVGAGACDERHEPLFRHRHAPAVPRGVESEGDWLATLDFTESTCRYDQAPRARFEPTKPARSSSGSCGPGAPMLMSSARGIEVNGRLLSWRVVLAGRSEQREIEPELARARDLAQAYHYLDYYGHAYAEPKPGEGWSPIPLMLGLAEEARELGGDPSLLEPRSEYMREALRQ